MTSCSVYLGSLEDPKFEWSGGDWNGNTPSAIFTEFPPMGRHYNGDFHAWVNISGVECKQTDYGGWVARVTKFQIIDFVAQVYAGKEDLPWVKQPLEAVNEFVATLDEKRVYALVATEY